MESATIFHPEIKLCRKANGAADHRFGYTGTTCLALVHNDTFLYQHDGRATQHNKERGGELKIEKVMDDNYPGKYFKVNDHIHSLIAGNVGDALHMIDHVAKGLKISEDQRSPDVAAKFGLEYIKHQKSLPIGCIFMGYNLSRTELFIYTVEGGTDVERNFKLEPRKYCSDLPGVLPKGRFAAIGSGSSAARSYLSKKWANKVLDSLPQTEIVEDMCQAMMWASLVEPGTGGWTTGPQTAAAIPRQKKTAATSLAKRESLNQGPQTAAAVTLLTKKNVVDLYHQFYDAYEEQAKSEERTLFVLWPQKAVSVCLHDTRSEEYFRDFGSLSHSHTIGAVSGCQLYRYVFKEVAAVENALKDLSERQSIKIEYNPNPEIGKLDVYMPTPGIIGHRAYVGKASKELLGKLMQGKMEATQARREAANANLRR